MILNSNYHFDLYNLVFINCFSCKIMEVQFFEYGFYGENLLGRSYLNNILVDFTGIPLHCYSGIHLLYKNTSAAKDHGKCMLVMDGITITGSEMHVSDFKYSTGIYVQLPVGFMNITFTVIISNSNFHDMNQKILDIVSAGCVSTNTTIKIKSCIFGRN